MKDWIENVISSKKTVAVPVMTHPGIELIGRSVKEACCDGQVHYEAIKALEAGTLHVFDTASFTVDGKTLTEYLADVDGDYTGETNVIHDGYFDESNAVDFRSAPYFDIIIDGVTNLNTNFGG